MLIFEITSKINEFEIKAFQINIQIQVSNHNLRE